MDYVRELFGTPSLFSEKMHPEDAVVLEDCELYALDRKHVHEFIKHRPEAAFKMLELITLRWRRSIERLHDLVCLDVPGRLAKVLPQFPHRFEEPSLDSRLLTRRLTQGELASLVASRESVNRCLRSFVREEWIGIEDGKVKILAEPELRKLFS